ncbi:HesA/MoeB/ThiF family protein [Roseateles sp. BYS180W]|uniref:HesA/MoeB/ThiF family protein n=1 Tax=Roseateles rivi TaxID=3299028 RepID=A0ABW7FVA2_9BURK
MNDEQLLRYSRHILLEPWGVEGQERVLAAHALIIGAGGLGSPVALYLGSAGVGRITLVDPDQVDVTNLQRQIAHSLARVGQDKVASAAAAIAAINPEPQVQALAQRADAQLLDELVPQADVVIDCSDNFETRQAVNAACVRHRRPLVFGSALGLDGQLSVFDPRRADSPCYACIFPPEAPPPPQRCALMGVLAPLVGVIGSLQAAEALKLMAGVGSALVGRLWLLDMRHTEQHSIALARRARCSCCGTPDPV